MIELLNELNRLKKKIENLESQESGVIISRSTAFPSNPKSDQLLYRSDRDILYVYKAGYGQWVSVAEYTATLNAPGRFGTAPNPAQLTMAPHRTDIPSIFTRVALSYTVFTTNNGSNYWTLLVRGLNALASVATTIYSKDTIADTVGVRVTIDVALAVVPANYAIIDLVVVPTGNPGIITADASAWYRLFG